jgi:aspartate aminotransferase
MEQLLSKRVLEMEESQTIAMSRKSREMKDSGVDVISLSLGEPDFNTPEFIKEAAKKAIDDNFSHYTAVPGLQEVREAVSAKFKRDNNLDYPADCIVLSTGAKQSLTQMMMALVNKGDEVILPAPYWVSYKQMTELSEGTVIEIPTEVENDFKITPEALEAAITDKTKVFLFSSPCNPSGSVYSKDELEGLVKVFDKYPNVVVISDEIYELINFTGEHASIGAFPSMKGRVATVNGMSKGFAMTGWRLGYVGAPKWLAQACTKMQGQITSATCAITQKASQAALQAEPAEMDFMKDTFLKRRNFILSRLESMEGVKANTPEGAFYVFPDVSAFFGKASNGKTIENASDLAEYLLVEGHVATVSGAAFGSPKCIRISYAAADDLLTKAMDRIEAALSKLS